MEYCIQFQLMDNGGFTSVDTAYEWYNSCWNLQGQPVSDDFEFDPGQGLWVYNWTGAEVALHIPAPEL